VVNTTADELKPQKTGGGGLLCAGIQDSCALHGVRSNSVPAEKQIMWPSTSHSVSSPTIATGIFLFT